MDLRFSARLPDLLRLCLPFTRPAPLSAAPAPLWPIGSLPVSSPFSPSAWTSAGRCQSQKSENCLLGPQGACSAGGRDVGRCSRVCLGPCSSLVFPQTGGGVTVRDVGPIGLSVYPSIPSRFFLADDSFVQTGCDLGLCSAGSIELSVSSVEVCIPRTEVATYDCRVGSIEFPVYPGRLALCPCTDRL